MDYIAGTEEALAVKDALLNSFLPLVESNLFKFRTTYYDAHAFHWEFIMLYIPARSRLPSLDPSFKEPCDIGSIVHKVLVQGITNEYLSLFPQDCSRPITNFTLIANMCDAMSLNLPEAISATGDFFDAIIKENHIDLRVASVVPQTVMNLIREDISSSLEKSDHEKVEAQGIIEMYRGLLNFERACLNLYCLAEGNTFILVFLCIF
jgi:hypothetical protein